MTSASGCMQSPAQAVPSDSSPVAAAAGLRHYVKSATAKPLSQSETAWLGPSCSAGRRQSRLLTDELAVANEVVAAAHPNTEQSIAKLARATQSSPRSLGAQCALRGADPQLWKGHSSHSFARICGVNAADSGYQRCTHPSSPPSTPSSSKLCAICEATASGRRLRAWSEMHGASSVRAWDRRGRAARGRDRPSRRRRMDRSRSSLQAARVLDGALSAPESGAGEARVAPCNCPKLCCETSIGIALP